MGFLDYWIYAENSTFGINWFDKRLMHQSFIRRFEWLSVSSLTLFILFIFSVFSEGQETIQSLPTYLFKYNETIYHLKAYKVVFLNFWKKKYIFNVGQIQNGIYNDVIKAFLITQKFIGKESHENKRFCKK